MPQAALWEKAMERMRSAPRLPVFLDKDLLSCCEQEVLREAELKKRSVLSNPSTAGGQKSSERRESIYVPGWSIVHCGI